MHEDGKGEKKSALGTKPVGPVPVEAHLKNESTLGQSALHPGGIPRMAYVPDVANGAAGESSRGYQMPGATVPAEPHLCHRPSKATLQLVSSGVSGVLAEGLPGLMTHTAQVMVPVEPHLGVLISMAVCLDHGFGLLSPERQASKLYDMRKLYDEVVGQGYYHPEREGYYQSFVGPGVKASMSKEGEEGWIPTYD